MQTHGKISTYRSGLCCRCKDCVAANRKYQREYRRRTRPDSTKYWERAKFKKELKELKSNPCTDCGNKFPIECMDFDHLPEFEKKFNIANTVDRSLDEIKKELAKCELVCSNCHRIRTANRRRVGGRAGVRTANTNVIET